jgi:hypothetical protein
MLPGIGKDLMRRLSLVSGAKTSKTDSRSRHVSEARYLTCRLMGMLAGTLETARPGGRAHRIATLSVCTIRWKARSPRLR